MVNGVFRKKKELKHSRKELGSEHSGKRENETFRTGGAGT